MELAPDLCRVVFDSFPEHIAIIEQDGCIKAVNAAWKNYAVINAGSLQQTGVGNNYLNICDESARTGNNDAAIVGEKLQQILQGSINQFSYEYPCHSPRRRQWFAIKCWSLHWEGSINAVVSHRDTSQSVLLRDELREQLQTKGYSDLKPGSLAEYLYNRHSLSNVEQLLAQDLDELLKRRWKLTDEQCEQQIALAIHYIRQD